MPKELNLNKPNEVLVVHIGDKDYSIPLATSLPYKEAKKLIKLGKTNEEEAIDIFVDFFSKYIPTEVLDELSLANLSALAKAWAGQTETEGGQSLGE